jgi:hypothetical protein
MSSQVPELTILNTDTSVPAHKISKTISGFSPQVPDLSITDPSKTTASLATQSRVLTQSYKDMLIDSQDEIIKQSKIQAPNRSDVRAMRQGLLMKSQTSDYRPNPLCKYVPSKIVKSIANSGNLSSILLDTFQAPLPQKALHETSSIEEDGDIQLKNVAGILSEIQKLITPSKYRESNNAQSSSEILRKLAKIYLNEDEYLSFAIEEELNL